VDSTNRDAGQSGKAAEAFKPIDAQRGGMVWFRRGRSDHADAKIVHGCSRKPPGGIEMLDGMCCPSDDGFSPDESSNTIYGQVTLS
jgi:hypothetical protein